MGKFWVLILVLSAAAAGQAATVELRSGNGGGSTDTLITFLLGPPSTDFTSAFSAADFTSAQSGTAASIITPNPAWVTSLVDDPSALWIGTSSISASFGTTGLFAQSFLLPFDVSSATLTLNFAVDNGLGETDQGIYLNGTALTFIGGGFSGEHTFTDSNIGSLLHAGTNTLFLDAVNDGGPGGLIYSATITTQDVTAGAPEPSTFALIGLALIGLAAAPRLLVRGRSGRGRQSHLS